MAKKTFKDNPALQFISSANENTDNTQPTDNTVEYEYTEQTHNTENAPERKTRRLNLLLQPSIFEDLSKIAHMRRTSVNNLINSVLKEYTETEEEMISMYNRVFSGQ